MLENPGKKYKLCGMLTMDLEKKDESRENEKGKAQE